MSVPIARSVVAGLVVAGAVAGGATAAVRTVDVKATAAKDIAAIAAGGGPAVVVPPRVPVDASGPIASTGGRHSARGYDIVLGAPGCDGADACTVARFSGDRRGTPRGTPVSLAAGVSGRFSPMRCGASCTPPSVSFRLGGVTYTLAVTPVAGEHRAQLVRLANQAIAAARPAPAPTPRQKVVCSETGDTCTGIYLRGTRIVIRRGFAAHYMDKDRLCLRYPGGQVACRTAPLRRVRGSWQAQAVFPMQDPGPYQVVGIKGARITAGT